MAVFFDLDDDDGFSISRSRGGRGSISHECHPPRQQYQLKPLNRGGSGGVEGPGHEKNIQVEEPLVPNKLAAVLTCYPYALLATVICPRCSTDRPYLGLLCPFPLIST